MDAGDAAPTPLAGTLTITPTRLPTAIEMLPFAQTLSATPEDAGVTFSLSAGTLPAGVELSSAGFLTGTPTASGKFSLSIEAKDTKSRVGRADYTFEVAPARRYGITSSSDNLVLATAVAATKKDAYVFTIQPGIVIGSASSTKPALDTGVFPEGSMVVIVNRGEIRGQGGAGGAIGIGGGAGSPGGTALALSAPTRLVNAEGRIYGGGGGGGASAPVWACGGGGGQGAQASSGGAGSSGAGAAGGPAGPGPGGVNSGPRGGAGGSWGTRGEDGVAESGVAGGSGGAGGLAVQKNGQPLTWVSGNDAEHAKGGEE